MSMDEVNRRMSDFLKELERFNEIMKSSIQDVHSNHEKVNPHWQDEMRRQYDAQWREFDEFMKRYLSADSKKYEEFLRRKKRLLKQYLQGR